MGVLRERSSELGHRLHRTAGIADEGERLSVVGAEENFAARSPGSILESRKRGDSLGGPPPGLIFFNLPSAKKASHLASGDQSDAVAPSVPGRT